MIFDSEQFFDHHPGVEHLLFGITVPAVETYMRFRPNDARSIGFLNRAAYLDAAYTGREPGFVNRFYGRLSDINKRQIAAEIAKKGRN